MRHNGREDDIYIFEVRTDGHLLLNSISRDTLSAAVPHSINSVWVCGHYQIRAPIIYHKLAPLDTVNISINDTLWSQSRLRELQSRLHPLASQTHSCTYSDVLLSSCKSNLHPWFQLLSARSAAIMCPCYILDIRAQLAHSLLLRSASIRHGFLWMHKKGPKSHRSGDSEVCSAIGFSGLDWPLSGKSHILPQDSQYRMRHICRRYRRQPTIECMRETGSQHSWQELTFQLLRNKRRSIWEQGWCKRGSG